jgi:hypothetical protein
VDHHLIALARGTGVDTVMERRLCEQRQSVGLLLLHEGRFCGNVPRVGGGVYTRVSELPGKHDERRSSPDRRFCSERANDLTFAPLWGAGAAFTTRCRHAALTH